MEGIPSNEVVYAVERNHAEAVLDVLYGVVYNDLNERFYRRVDGAFSLLNLLGGSTVVGGTIAGLPYLAGSVGLVIAVLAYVEREVRPGQKAVACANYREKYGNLASRAAGLDLAALDCELRLLQSSGPPTINALSVPALNANLRANGFHERCERLTWTERIASAIA